MYSYNRKFRESYCNLFSKTEVNNALIRLKNGKKDKDILKY